MYYKLEEFVAANGRNYFGEWLSKLDKTTRGYVLRRLRRVEAGNFGDSKTIGEGVFELRFNFGPGYRVYYGLIGREIILLLMGSDKGDQSRAIARAKQLWKEHNHES